MRDDIHGESKIYYVDIYNNEIYKVLFVGRVCLMNSHHIFSRRGKFSRFISIIEWISFCFARCRRFFLFSKFSAFPAFFHYAIILFNFYKRSVYAQ